VYAPNGGSITVNLSATTRTLNVEGSTPARGPSPRAERLAEGREVKPSLAPFSGDAVLYLVDAAGHN